MAARLKPWFGLAGFLILCFAAAGLGSIFTSSSVNSWYPYLTKPAWNPPAWLFGPVWTMLYIAMAVAAWLVWRAHGFSKGALPLAVFMIQLALNAAWSGLFFGLRDPGLAFLEIIVLWLAIATTLLLFWNYARLAAYLILPYLLWVSYAGVLNFFIWRLNP